MTKYLVRYSSGKKKLFEISFCVVLFRALFYFVISRTRFHASCIPIVYSCGHESSQDLVQDIWDFARFCTRYHLGFCDISYEISFRRSRMSFCVLNTMC